MDPEKKQRKSLIKRLGQAFTCHEEASLSRPNGTVRCDVLALPRDPDFADHLLAFECKRPSQEWHYAPWSKAIRQAFDYVDGNCDLGTVSAAFVFPAPMFVPSPAPFDEHPLVRPGFENAVAGMFHLGLYLRVGRAGPKSYNDDFFMTLGPNEIWNSLRGFTRNAYNLLKEGRPLGSGNRSRKSD